MLTAAQCRDYEAFVERHQRYVYPLLAARLARLRPKAAGPVVDMGTGPGYLTVELARLYTGPVHAVDVNPAMHDLARGRLAASGVADRVRLDVADVHALPYPDGFADVVVSYSCYHHWSDPVRALRECARILAPGGTLVLFDTRREIGPARAQLARMVEPRWFGPVVEKALAESYEPPEVRAHLERAGMADAALDELAFGEDELMDALDALADVPVAADDDDEVAPSSWQLVYVKGEATLRP